MAPLLPYRFAHWLTTLVVALWPAAAAQACCCTVDQGADSGCQASCCEAQADACCQGVPIDSGVCCSTSRADEECGCGLACGRRDVRQTVSVALDQRDLTLAAALAGESGPLPSGPASSDLAIVAGGPEIPKRPKRILYGVWRN